MPLNPNEQDIKMPLRHKELEERSVIKVYSRILYMLYYKKKMPKKQCSSFYQYILPKDRIE